MKIHQASEGLNFFFKKYITFNQNNNKQINKNQEMETLHEETLL